MSDGWKEECGVFGVYTTHGDQDVSSMTYLGLYALQHRGQESAGIAITNGTWMDVNRGMGLVNEVFRHQLPHMENEKIAIGHVRYSTTGSSLLENTQPLIANYSGGKISLAHNGNLTNAAEIRHHLELAGTMFQTSVDSEVILNLIARSHQDTVEERLSESLQQIKGAFSLVLMTEKQLIGARDPHGFRPMCLGKLKDDEGYVLSSETCGLDVIGAEFIRDIAPGEIIVIDEHGVHSKFFVEPGKIELASCVFEYIYFARPDSIIDGQSVHQARFEMGKILAKEDPLKGQFDPKNTVVISVPDSGTTAATGYAFESGLPFVEGLIKNRYIGRTFIQPLQKNRDISVKLKLNPVRHSVAGKSVILVDDSIVRGTTSGKIVKMLRQAEAKEVHMRVSSPPIGFPCYYGIDTSVRKELIAASKTVDEICEYIQADSLHFLSIEGLKHSFANIDANQMCYACFNSDYPIAQGAFPASSGKYIFERNTK